MSASTPRRTYEKSCAELQRLGFLEDGELPPMPAGRPQHDDPEPLGVSFFRTQVSGDLSNLTLPRTFFGRSEVGDVSFCNTDLSESTLCWCDFVDVDFSNCCLRDSDLRAARFERANFSNCDLRGADARMASFQGCSFDGADVTGMKMTRAQGVQAGLGRAQAGVVDWCSSDGEEPGGG